MRIYVGAVFLFVTCTNAAWAQAADAPAKSTFAVCEVRQLITKMTKTRVAAQASGSCDNIGEGAAKSCQIAISATANNYSLDSSEFRNTCFRLSDGENPCNTAQFGPVIFTSEKSASQTVMANSGRVSVQLTIGQFEASQATESETGIQNLQLLTGGQFAVKRTKMANSTVTLECKKPSGEQFINLVPGKDNSGGKIQPVGTEKGEAFDLHIFQVLP